MVLYNSISGISISLHGEQDIYERGIMCCVRGGWGVIRRNIWCCWFVCLLRQPSGGLAAVIKLVTRAEL